MRQTGAEEKALPALLKNAKNYRVYKGWYPKLSPGYAKSISVEFKVNQATKKWQRANYTSMTDVEIRHVQVA